MKFATWGPKDEAAGRYGFCVETLRWEFNVHVIVGGADAMWGYQAGWWNGQLESLGFGRALLLVWREL